MNTTLLTRTGITTLLATTIATLGCSKADQVADDVSKMRQIQEQQVADQKRLQEEQKAHIERSIDIAKKEKEAFEKELKAKSPTPASSSPPK